MSDPTLQDIEERFVYRDMCGIDGKDVTYLLRRIRELEQKHETLLERLERLPRFNNLTGSDHGLPEFGITGDMTQHEKGLWVRWVSVQAAMKEARSE